MIQTISKQVGNRYDIEDRELWGEGYLALLDSRKTYNNKKGDLEKHLSLGIRYRLKNSAKFIKEEVSSKHIRGIDLYAQEEKTPFEYLSEIKLSQDAMEIIRIIQNIPDKLFKRLERNRKTPKTIFERYLRNERNWKHQRIERCFQELRNNIKRGN